MDARTVKLVREGFVIFPERKKEAAMRVTCLKVVVFLMALGALAACSELAATAEATRRSDLRSLIEVEISSHVRISYGELAGQNFSDADLERFLSEKVPDQIVQSLKNDTRFLTAVEKIRAMKPDERAAYLQRCRAPLHRTWSELGAISPKGQTEAGQRAELAVSNAIVDLAAKVLAGPPGTPKK
jgi:hypothetical protein